MAFHFSHNKKPLHARTTARDHAKNETKPTLLLRPDESCLKINKKQIEVSNKWQLKQASIKVLFFS